MSITDALADVRDALIAGTDPNTAVTAAAEDYGLAPTLVTNRARLAYGDLATYAARTAPTRTLTPEAERKLALGRTREAIQQLGQVVPGSPEAARLTHLIEQANALGGQFRVVSQRRRA